MYADIAILDDDQEDAFQVQDLIFKMQGNWHVDQYTEGQKLIEAVKSGKNYDLLLLDIYLKSESGMEIAKKLRSMIPENGWYEKTAESLSEWKNRSPIGA